MPQPQEQRCAKKHVLGIVLWVALAGFVACYWNNCASIPFNWVWLMWLVASAVHAGITWLYVRGTFPNAWLLCWHSSSSSDVAWGVLHYGSLLLMNGPVAWLSMLTSTLPSDCTNVNVNGNGFGKAFALSVVIIALNFVQLIYCYFVCVELR